MNGSTAAGGRDGTGSSGLWRYVAAWMIAGAVAVAGVLVLLGSRADHGSTPTVAVPPLRQVSLGMAVRRARCTLALRRAEAAPTGPRSARPGVFPAPIPLAVREAALRRGFIVIEYRRDLGPELVDQLRTIQKTVPTATVLAPAAGGARDALVVASAARELRCARVTPTSLDAMRLFRGRFLGTTKVAR